MKKLTSLLAACLFVCVLAFGQQYETIVLNYEKSYFGENQPLPALKFFMLSGIAPEAIPYIEVKIYSGKGKEKRRPIYTTFGNEMKTTVPPAFNIPVNFKLRESKEYDVLINFFRPINERERAKMVNDLFKTLDMYVDQSFEVSRKRMTLLKSNRQVIDDLNTIVKKGMSLYRSRTLVKFESFSDMVRFKLKQVDKEKLAKGKKLNMGNDTLDARLAYRGQIINSLKTLLHHEVRQYLNQELYILKDDKFIDDYPTENLKNILALNIGYGGAFLNFDDDDFNYINGPFLGLSFPFGREGLSKPFWSKTSINIGAMLQSKFEDQNGDEVSGPIFKVPIYGGLGFQVYRFITLNVGAVLLEDAETAGTVSGLEDRIRVKPFVGLSARINLWMDLGE